ncbi:hypothetical protein JX580_11030 [Thiomicrospira microaerophila]|uniref:hypothetical protein n=1 Tax=Thiomicrospira microaerophila TaxID=406020 RepID=UPI00200EA48B|nr:hypothetical protein [Thiomicrospira microaerophila]UQB42173.1 hypothetical protein JX580_11030 [Thiomicrospira microaerophila]
MIALERKVLPATQMVHHDVAGFLKGLSVFGDWQACLVTEGLKHHVVNQFSSMRTRGQRIMGEAPGIQASFFSQKIYAVAVDWLDGLCFLNFKDRAGVPHYRLRSLAEPGSVLAERLKDWVAAFASQNSIGFKRFNACRQTRQIDKDAVRQAWQQLVHPQQAASIFKAHQYQLLDLYQALSPDFAKQMDRQFILQVIETCRNERLSLSFTARNACLTQAHVGRIKQGLDDEQHIVIRDTGFKLELSDLSSLGVWQLRIPSRHKVIHQIKLFNRLGQEILSIDSPRPSVVWNNLFV